MRKLFLLLALGLGGRVAQAQVWSPQISQTQRDLYSIFFVNEWEGWAMGDASGGNAAGNLRRTLQQGLPWEAVSLGQTNADLYGSYFFDAQTGLGVGRHSSGHEDGLLIRTEDGGSSWSIHLSWEEALADVHFADAQHGWLVGEEGFIARSTDGGLSWLVQQGPESEDLFGIYAIDGQRAIAVGEDGLLIRTGDGGQTWQVVSIPSEADLTSVFFANALSGWVAGEDGTLLHSADGGLSWNSQNSGTDRDLTDIHFTDSLTGWAVGKYGTVRHTSDGGLTWASQNSGTSQHIWALHMVSDSLGWFCGYNGMIHIYQPGPGSNNPLQAEFAVSASACVGDTLSLQDLSQGTPSNWQWSFGDGQTANTSAPLVVYSNPGTYVITLIAGDNAGNSDTVQHAIVVNQPNLQLSPALPTSCGPGDSVLMVVTGASTYTWSPSQFLSIDTGATVIAFPLQTMSFQVVGMDAQACVASLTVTVQVDSVSAPVAAMLPIDTFHCGPLLVDFENHSLFAQSFEWSFPGGQPSSSQAINPQVFYAQAGVYEVGLIAQGCGGNDTILQLAAVSIGTPVQAAFLASTDTLILANDSVVSFLDNSSGATSWAWNFGNGSVDSVPSPSTVYSQSGLYVVQLVAANAACADTAFLPLVVQDSAQMRLVSGSPPILVAPNPVVNTFVVRLPDQVQGEVEVEILDLSGKLLRPVQRYTTPLVTLHRAELPAGVVLLRIVANGHPPMISKILIAPK